METPTLNGKTGADVVQTLLDWEKFYNECAVRHDGLVDAIRQMKVVQQPK